MKNNKRPIIVTVPADMSLAEVYEKCVQSGSIAPPSYISSLEATISEPIPRLNAINEGFIRRT